MKPWKRAEQKCATAIGSRRTPLSGGASQITRSDSLHPTIYLETKYRKRFAVVELMRETEVKARVENKVAVLGLVQKGLHTRYYLIPEPLMRLLMTLCPTALKFDAPAFGAIGEHEPLESIAPKPTDSSDAGSKDSPVYTP